MTIRDRLPYPINRQLHAFRSAHLKYPNFHSYHVIVGSGNGYSSFHGKDEEIRLFREKKKQAGITFPSAAKQEYALIIRFDLKPTMKGKTTQVRKGLKDLCTFFERIDGGDIKVEVIKEIGETELFSLSNFNFSSTVGFGLGFFEKLRIRNRPRKLFEMSDNSELGDPFPYLYTQTDMIVQICSTNDYLNRWVLNSDSYPRTTKDERQQFDSDNRKNAGAHDIKSAIKEWAVVTDVNSGFQRLDGRNLMGFTDGISQPRRFRNNVVWTTRGDEMEKLVDGTYMVFLKIEHDLDQWAKLNVAEQEQWIGRSKATGLLLGTLSHEEDERLAEDCRSNERSVRKNARSKLKKLLAEQKDPNTPFYDKADPRFKNISLQCPVWSHVRKANPRGSDGVPRKLIFRRGYLYMEDTVQSGGHLSSGLLFICFQKDIRNGFEYIKKNFLNNKNFPVPAVRKYFSPEEIAYRRLHGRFREEELKKLGSYQRTVIGLNKSEYALQLEESKDEDKQNTGRDGLSGPSQLGIYPRGDFAATVSLGGGYYFIPPIPDKKISEIGQQFFD